MSFETRKNVGDVKGVFQGIYTMCGPFKLESDARDFYGKLKISRPAIFVVSNHTLYILKEDANVKVIEVKPPPPPPPPVIEAPVSHSWFKKG